jgi:hypothetical protein
LAEFSNGHYLDRANDAPMTLPPVVESAVPLSRGRDLSLALVAVMASSRITLCDGIGSKLSKFVTSLVAEQLPIALI